MQIGRYCRRRRQLASVALVSALAPSLRTPNIRSREDRASLRQRHPLLRHGRDCPVECEKSLHADFHADLLFRLRHSVARVSVARRGPANPGDRCRMGWNWRPGDPETRRHGSTEARRGRRGMTNRERSARSRELWASKVTWLIAPSVSRSIPSLPPPCLRVSCSKPSRLSGREHRKTPTTPRGHRRLPRRNVLVVSSALRLPNRLWLRVLTRKSWLFAATATSASASPCGSAVTSVGPPARCQENTIGMTVCQGTWQTKTGPLPKMRKGMSNIEGLGAVCSWLPMRCCSSLSAFSRCWRDVAQARRPRPRSTPRSWTTRTGATTPCAHREVSPLARRALCGRTSS